MARILVVDDDPHIRELVAHYMRREGFNVTEAADGAEALCLYADIKPDLVILDIMMPGVDGWTLCSKLRELADLPLLMLTAKGESSQIVKGFALGTDDYLVKPFDPEVLVVRVKSLLRRYRIMASQSVQVGTLTMDRRTYACTAGQATLTLPRKEFELLFMLAGSPGRTFTRDHLIEQIWGFDYEGDERTVDVHIKRLREKFPETQHGFRIRTIRGLGYRLEECL